MKTLIAVDSSGDWKVFNGNEVGAILGWWAWHKAPKESKQDLYMISSTVSSKILKRVAEVEGFNFVVSQKQSHNRILAGPCCVFVI